MQKDHAVVRQEHLLNLGRFCRGLSGALQQVETPADGLPWHTAISGECVTCGIRVTGEELLAVAEPAGAEETNAKLQRLRQGYCARNACDAYFYRLTFDPRPGLDWNELLTRAEAISRESNQPSEAEITARKAIKRATQWRMAARVAIGLAIILFLLLVRQWYLGGAIPLIRQPENFKVDVLPHEHHFE